MSYSSSPSREKYTLYQVYASPLSQLVSLIEPPIMKEKKWDLPVVRKEKHILDDVGNSFSHSRNLILHNKVCETHILFHQHIFQKTTKNCKNPISNYSNMNHGYNMNRGYYLNLDQECYYLIDISLSTKCLKV